VATGPHDPEFVRAHGLSKAVRSYFIRHPYRFLRSIEDLPQLLASHTHAVPV
jgi:hypothetical protein